MCYLELPYYPQCYAYVKIGAMGAQQSLEEYKLEDGVTVIETPLPLNAM